MIMIIAKCACFNPFIEPPRERNRQLRERAQTRREATETGALPPNSGGADVSDSAGARPAE